MRKRIILLLLVLALCFNYVGYVSCDDQSLKTIYSALRAAGFPSIAAAATVGCVYGESNGSPSCVESGSGGKGIGIMQWSNDDRGYLADYCAGSSHSGHEKVTLRPANGRSSGYTVCNRYDCQLAFWMTQDLKPRMDNYKWSMNYNSQVQKLSILKAAVTAGRLPASINVTHSYDGWLNQTRLEDSVIQLCVDFYTPTASKCFWIYADGTKLSSYSESDTVQTNFSKVDGTYDRRFNYAKKALAEFEGAPYTPMASTPGTSTPGVSTASPGGTAQDDFATGLGTQLYSAGYFTEAQLAAYCSLTETNIEEVLLANASTQNLGQKDLEGLTDWKRNHDGNLKETGYIATLRWIVQLVGILVTIWALFVYLAFWFDHVNSFVYIDALHVLTFGQLHICAPGDKPTFSMGKKVKDKTVSHGQILGICLTAILFGTLMISGVYYILVSKLVNFIMSWFAH